MTSKTGRLKPSKKPQPMQLSATGFSTHKACSKALRHCRRQAGILNGSCSVSIQPVMITGVATWRCRCGFSIKVVTETDRANSYNPDRLIASCPNCKGGQVIYAHRIISVTLEERDGLFPVPPSQPK